MKDIIEDIDYLFDKTSEWVNRHFPDGLQIDPIHGCFIIAIFAVLLVILIAKVQP